MSLDKSRRARTWIGVLLRSTACGAARGLRVLRRRKPRLIGAPAWPFAIVRKKWFGSIMFFFRKEYFGNII